MRVARKTDNVHVLRHEVPPNARGGTDFAASTELAQYFSVQGMKLDLTEAMYQRVRRGRITTKQELIKFLEESAS